MAEDGVYSQEILRCTIFVHVQDNLRVVALAQKILFVVVRAAAIVVPS
jgi:hypothetical protein